MKTQLTLTAALILTTSTASALGLDRSGQSIGVLFEDGNHVELSYGYVKPTLTGNDAAAFGGSPIGDVADNYSQAAIGYKSDINDQLSYAIIVDQPYGADIAYPSTADGGGIALAGTRANLESRALTALLRYKINPNISVYGGIRAEQIKANITLNGAAYGPLAGYNVDLAEDTAYGYSVGVAYERPEIALRVALTYSSSLTHKFDTIENGAPSLVTEVETPQAINLDFQSGVATDTLVFGSIRWADYDQVIVSPAGFSAATGGASLTSIDSGVTYNIGVGRRFNDQLSGSISFGYEPSGDDLVSPLSPSSGNYSIALGAEYAVNDMVTVSGGVRYIKVGEAMPATAGEARADFRDNDAVGIGMKVAYSF